MYDKQSTARPACGDEGADLIAGEHVDEVWQGQHEVVVDAPAVPAAGIRSKQGRQEVCKGPGAGLLVGYAELVQSLHQGCHHLYPHCIALIAQQVQKRPASREPLHALPWQGLSSIHESI